MTALVIAALRTGILEAVTRRLWSCLWFGFWTRFGLSARFGPSARGGGTRVSTRGFHQLGGLRSTQLLVLKLALFCTFGAPGLGIMKETYAELGGTPFAGSFAFIGRRGDSFGLFSLFGFRLRPFGGLALNCRGGSASPCS